jgi:hypothetical protein
MIWDFIDRALPDYSGLTASLVFLYVVAGVFGALVRASWLNKPIRGVYRGKDGGLRLGFYGEILVAVAVAIVVDGHPVRAGIAAVFAPTILWLINNFIRETLPAAIRTLLMAHIGNKTPAEPTDKEEGPDA